MADVSDRLKAALSDRYAIEQEIGSGGMATVYVARDVRHDRQVAVKVLRPELAAALGSERFHQEIKIAANLHHPHILPLYDSGEADGFLYYVMPYEEGQSLRDKLAREGELPIPEAVRILRDVVDALDHAHKYGVVHRDIKPDNILLSERHALVTDFGVAKAVSEATGIQQLTTEGVALGTPAYMSPEQAAADKRIDHRADIYAVGALAYELLAGRPPFIGTTPQEVVAAHVTLSADPLGKHRATVPMELEQVVMRCLEKKPADRWQNAEDMLRQLDALATPGGGITPTETQPVEFAAHEMAVRRAHPARVSLLYAIASAGMLALVFALMFAVGLPDWVVPAAVVILLAGFPLMLFTGFHERRRAEAATTGTRVPTPTGIVRHFTWPTALAVSTATFAALAIGTGGYVAMRAMGIGPAGTLMASGVLEARDPLIVVDFENHTEDSTLAAAVTGALRIDLAQSPVVKLVERADIGPVLERMNLHPGERLDLALAREIAVREGYKGIITGEVSPLGTGYVLSARLVSAETGETLVPVRENAAGDAELVDAVDRLSARLRERIGESFKSLRASERLERVTTSSLDALKFYTQAHRAEEEGDWERAINLLEEAVSVDSSFASAYRSLGIILSNNFRERSRVIAAARRAFELRDRLPPVERYKAIANYYEDVEPDREEALRAYRLVLEVDPESFTALNNAALLLMGQHEYEEAEEFLTRAHEAAIAWQSFSNLAIVQFRQGHRARAESTLAAYKAWGPRHPRAINNRILFATALGDYATADSLVPVLDSLGRDAFASFWAYALDVVRGRIEAAKRRARERVLEVERRGDHADVLQWSIVPARIEWRFGRGSEEAVRLLEQGFEQYPLEIASPEDRPYYDVAATYAAAGRVAEVSRLREEQDAAMTPTVAERYRWDALVATAEGRHTAAAEAYRRASEYAANLSRDLFDMAASYDLAEQADSALAVYERALAAPEPIGMVFHYDKLGPTYKRVGELYEARGDRERAVEYYSRLLDLWSDADPQLQEILQDVRNRITRLVAEPRR
jgi:tetratricopeptide (TPR) repeat protein